MARKKRIIKRHKSKKQDDTKLFALLAVLLSILGFIIAILAKRDNEYVMFYAKQSLILFLAGIGAKVISVLLTLTIVGILIIPFVWVIYAILFIIALFNSVSGSKRETPWIGSYTRKINL